MNIEQWCNVGENQESQE